MIPKLETYKIRSFFNASHTIHNEPTMKGQHSHTWQVICNIRTLSNNEVSFTLLDHLLKEALDPLEDHDLNTLPSFRNLEPNVAEVTKYIAQQLQPLLTENQLQLVKIEVGNTPIHYYCLIFTD